MSITPWTYREILSASVGATSTISALLVAGFAIESDARRVMAFTVIGWVVYFVAIIAAGTWPFVIIHRGKQDANLRINTNNSAAAQVIAGLTPTTAVRHVSVIPQYISDRSAFCFDVCNHTLGKNVRVTSVTASPQVSGVKYECVTQLPVDIAPGCVGIFQLSETSPPAIQQTKSFQININLRVEMAGCPIETISKFIQVPV